MTLRRVLCLLTAAASPRERWVQVVGKSSRKEKTLNSLLHRTCAFTSAVVATLAVVAAVGSTTAPASVAQLGCGAIITTDTTLDSDLTSCPSNGIVIGADDITLDLNSHTVGGGVGSAPMFSRSAPGSV